MTTGVLEKKEDTKSFEGAWCTPANFNLPAKDYIYVQGFLHCSYAASIIPVPLLVKLESGYYISKLIYGLFELELLLKAICWTSIFSQLAYYS